MLEDSLGSKRIVGLRWRSSDDCEDNVVAIHGINATPLPFDILKSLRYQLFHTTSAGHLFAVHLSESLGGKALTLACKGTADMRSFCSSKVVVVNYSLMDDGFY